MSGDDTLGAFEEHVLLGVARTAPESYGMAVRREIEAVTDREVTVGAVDATLDRLEAQGWLRSARVDGRRTFAVTRDGARALAATRAARERLWRGFDLAALGA